MASTRKVPTDATLNALSASEDSLSGFPFFTIGEDPHYTAYLKMFWFLLQVGMLSDELRVYKDTGGELQFGVNAGRFPDGLAMRTYAGATGQALTDDATNYIYLTAAAVLTVNITGWPHASHIPLATIDTGSESVAGTSGYYDFVDITDFRGLAVFSPVNPAAGRFAISEGFVAAPGVTLPAPWASDTHNTATADYMADEPTGVYQLALTAANSAEAAQLTHGNQRMIDTDNDPVAEFLIRVDGIADLTSVERIFIGLIADHTNAEDSLDNVDHSVGFLLKGAADLNIYQEADDGTTDTDDEDTGINLVDDTWTVFRIDMSDLTAVVMSVDGVATAATLDMTQSAGQVLQPIVCIQRDDNSQAEVGFQVEIDLAQAQAGR